MASTYRATLKVRRLALNATKAAIRARGDKVQLYTAAQLKVMADEMIGPCSDLGRVGKRARLKPERTHSQSRGCNECL